MTAISVQKAPQYGAVRWWLLSVAALIAIMVLVGGATRLTESGLSIVEWKPVTGALPPLTEAQWSQAFEGYKQIPQYRELNAGMTLAEFKTIFWWEWSHRLLGRVIDGLCRLRGTGMVRRVAAILMAAAVVAGVGACGQKGPLYLPDKGGTVVTRPGGGQAQQQSPETAPQPSTQPQPANTDSKKKDQAPR